MTIGKISVSLESSLLDFLAQYQETHQVRSKSEVVARALALLRERELEGQYAAALAEWQGSGDAELWDGVTGDGVTGEGLGEDHDAAR
ncbi:hypothetical protein [Deinococcus arenicola]|uniref:Antitoxin n=1 Tax=Deinococcus arenicola TaxID=2994950 RepID=A0ABU4DPA8_9DEIO|nr:hypothetical protein [Deinococcus sp. ZS9-10]MDV6374267.1 hypothetical protein [Deinococcus sp. ZS9-10]